MAWFQGSVWEKIRRRLEYVPGVIKAIKSAKIEIAKIETVLPLSCRVTYFLTLHSNVQGKMQLPYNYFCL